jgi:hypothetical protein
MEETLLSDSASGRFHKLAGFLGIMELSIPGGESLIGTEYSGLEHVIWVPKVPAPQLTLTP